MEHRVSPSQLDQRNSEAEQQANTQREALLVAVINGLRWPMTVLGIVWVVLLIVELALPVRAPWDRWLSTTQMVIWGLFALHFAVELFVAPSKSRYLRKNWLTAVAVVLPAFRILTVFRLFRLLRVIRGLSFLRLITSVNRGLSSIGRIAGVAQFPYILGGSLLIVFAVAAGLTYFERDSGSELGTFGEALWWSAAMLTTVGSGDQPATLEGRLLGLLMMVYSIAVFGYITATLAGYFVHKNTARAREERTSSEETVQDELRQLRSEIAALRSTLQEKRPAEMKERQSTD